MSHILTKDPAFMESVDCTAWLSDHSCGIEVTEYPVTITYQSMSKPEAVKNWHSPASVLFYSDDGAIWTGEAEDSPNHYREYSVTRSDAYGWKTSASDLQYESQHTGDWTDWDSWIAQNKQGSTCTITAVRYGRYALIRMENSGIIVHATTTLPNNAEEKLYFALTGEQCILTDFMLNREPEPIGPGTIDPPTDKTALFMDAEGDIPNINCSGWWTEHSDGITIDNTPLHISFHSVSYPQAKGSWHAPLVVLFSSLDGLVDGVAYTEYSVTRCDGYGWSVDKLGYIAQDNHSDDSWDWEKWLAANKKGVDCTITAYKKDDLIIIEQKNSGLEVTSRTIVPYGTGLPFYIALSGELCAISNIHISHS